MTGKGTGETQTLKARIRGAGKRFSVSSSAKVLQAAKAAAALPSWDASSAPWRQWEAKRSTMSI